MINFVFISFQILIRMFTTRSCLAAATAKIRAVKRRSLIPTRCERSHHFHIEIFFISRAALTLTPEAVQRVKDLTQGVPDCLGLRIGVKQRGCNGMSYTLDYANKKEKFDEIVAQDGVNIFIDKKAQLSILGK